MNTGTQIFKISIDYQYPFTHCISCLQCENLWLDRKEGKNYYAFKHISCEIKSMSPHEMLSYNPGAITNIWVSKWDLLFRMESNIRFVSL